MKKIYKAIGIALLAAAIVFSMTACGGGGGDGGPDNRVELTAGSNVSVAATATSASVTFTGAGSLDLNASDFTVSGGTGISSVSVSSGTVTVTVGFSANTNPAAQVTYTVGINSGSTKIKGSASVTITQAAATPLNLIAINQAIAEAESLNTTTIVGTAADQVVAGVYWVSQDAKTTFEAAIAAAKTARTNATTQGEIDSAKSTLDSAKTTFENARTVGTQASGLTGEQLGNLITITEAVKENIVINTDPNAVKPGEYYVPQSALDAFNAAIAAAQAAIAAGGNLDEATAALVTAKNTFEAARQFGADTTTVLGELGTAINTANNAKNDVTIDTIAGNVLEGQLWVTQAVLDALNTAINAALAKNNSNSTYNEVTAAKTTLEAAITTFNNAKQLGTKVPPTQSIITITGMSAYNGKEFQFGLHPESIDTLLVGQNEPPVWGSGTITNGTAVIELYDSSTNQPWLGTGTWDMGFFIDADPIPEIFRINSKHNFTANPSPTFTLSTHFTKMTVFQITLGQFLEMMGEEVGNFSKTLGTLLNEIQSGMDYAALKEYMGGIGWFTDAAMTQEMNNSTQVTQSTVIYVAFPFWMGGEENRGEKVGEITGTISLTDIPAGINRFEIFANCRYNQPGQYIGFNTQYQRFNIPQNTNNIPFTINIYERDLENYSGSLTGITWDTQFYVLIDLPGNTSAYSIKALDTDRQLTFTGSDVPGMSAGSLGTVSLDFVELKGTINITYNGSAVPWLDLQANVQSSMVNGGQEISPNGATNVQFTIPFSKSSAGQPITFKISGRPSRNSRWEDRLFDCEQVYRIESLPVDGQTGITINIGNLTPNAIKVLNPPAGTYTVYIVNTYDIHTNYSNIVNNNQYVVGKGTGTGDSITLTENNLGNEGWYLALIVSDSGSRYANYSSSYVNGIGILDWNNMYPITP